MWLITPLGFFSIVCKPDNEKQGTLTVRSRLKSDLEALRENFLPSLGSIAEGAGTDYRFRAKAQRNDIGKALAQMVQNSTTTTSRTRWPTNKAKPGPGSMAGSGTFFMTCRKRQRTCRCSLTAAS